MRIWGLFFSLPHPPTHIPTTPLPPLPDVKTCKHFFGHKELDQFGEKMEPEMMRQVYVDYLWKVSHRRK